MQVRVAGFTIQVGCLAADLKVAPGDAYAPFVVPPQDETPPDVRVEAGWHTGEDDGARDCLFDSGGAWRLYRHDAGFLFRFFSSNLESSPYKIARFSHDFSQGRVLLHRPFFPERASVDPLEYPLDELLVISLLAQGRGIEMHGCGVVDRGAKGYLFLGQSGAGKSTTARLWLAEGDALVLSDDRIVVRRDRDGLWMYGTPWHGEARLATARRAPLSGVFFLRQHERDEVFAVSRGDAVARMLAASFPPFHDAPALQFCLDFLDSIAGELPCAELRFRPTAAAVHLIREIAV